MTTGEARDTLHQIARRFDAGQGEPVYFGSHRRAQGVIVPVEQRVLRDAATPLAAQLSHRRRRSGGKRNLVPARKSLIAAPS